MNPLEVLSAKLKHAAQNPPELLVTKKSVAFGTKMLMASARDSRGRNRPVVRQTLAQQRAQIERVTGRVTKEEADRLEALAKEMLA